MWGLSRWISTGDFGMRCSGTVRPGEDRFDWLGRRKWIDDGPLGVEGDESYGEVDALEGMPRVIDVACTLTRAFSSPTDFAPLDFVLAISPEGKPTGVLARS